MKDDILPISDLKNIIVFIVNTDGKILAHGSGGIYSDKSIIRKSDNAFNSNTNRSFWIDNVRSFVRRKGYGSRIVQEIEKFFWKNTHLIDKGTLKNFYVTTKYTKNRFYVSNGYDEIKYRYQEGLIDEEEDEDNFNLFFHGGTHELACYAKPMHGKLDEEEYLFNINDLSSDTLVHMIQSVRKELRTVVQDGTFDMVRDYIKLQGFDKEELEDVFESWISLIRKKFDKGLSEVVKTRLYDIQRMMVM